MYPAGSKFRILASSLGTAWQRTTEICLLRVWSFSSTLFWIHYGHYFRVKVYTNLVNSLEEIWKGGGSMIILAFVSFGLLYSPLFQTWPGQNIYCAQDRKGQVPPFKINAMVDNIQLLYKRKTTTYRKSYNSQKHRKFSYICCNTSGKFYTYIYIYMGPNIDPWGTPYFKIISLEVTLFMEVYILRFVR